MLLTWFLSVSPAVRPGPRIDMTPAQVLLVLVLCGAFRAQLMFVTEDEGGVSLNPEKTTEEDVRVLLRQLTARVEQLEKEREDRGQSLRSEPSGAHGLCRVLS